eukprot:scaffold852_cov187-Skeletonema_menzelii.AAC.1
MNVEEDWIRNIVLFTYTGVEGEVIPDEATHVIVTARVIRANAFFKHRNIVEVICNEDVEKIEEMAFFGCRSLRRVFMRGVKNVEKFAFLDCESLEDVESDRLEIIGKGAFRWCYSLRSINLTSARIVEKGAFYKCIALKYVKFGNKLESFGVKAFNNCTTLEQITLPLKDGLISSDDIFQGCGNLKRVDLIEGELHTTIAALHSEDWRNDMNVEIDSINLILPNTPAGFWDDDWDDDVGDPGEKGQEIRRWIRSVLGKIIDYQVEHRRLLEEDIATALLELVLPNNDIVMNNVLPFLELPSHTFELVDEEGDSDDEMQSSGSSLGDESDNNIVIWFTYTGADGEVIDDEATHVIVTARVIRAHAFHYHPNIVEVICNDDVEKIEEWAFDECPSLRRVIMRGVKVVECCAFYWCVALEDVECDKLEIIGEGAFDRCESLRSINLTSARIVEEGAFSRCEVLTDVKFGNKLESFGVKAFCNCESLERITIPLKDGLITDDGVFIGCINLKRVDLIEGEWHETIAALQLEAWRNDMDVEIDSINLILPNTPAGFWDEDWDDGDGDPGEKAQEIRRWIRSVLRKIIDYQEEHRRLLEEDVATTLELVLPNNDIVTNNVLPFLELPSYTFEVVDDEDEEGDSDDEMQSSGSSLGDEEDE